MPPTRSLVCLIAAAAAASASAASIAAAEDNASGGASDAAKIQRLRGVEYVRRGEVPLTADIYIPEGRGPFPGVLMIHGGGWFAGSKWNLLDHANFAARSGYTVVSINYRLAPAAKFPAQLHDCKEAVRWMRRNAEKYRIDPQRIAAYGYSAGGHLAALLGVTSPQDQLEQPSAGGDPPDAAPDEDAGPGEDAAPAVSARVAAVVAGGAPCDLQSVPENSWVLKFFLGGTRAERPDVYRAASPTSYVSRDDPPLFMFHGGSDLLVPRSRAEALHTALRRAGGRSEFHLVEGKGHLGAFLDLDARRRAVAFLDRVLKDR